ncbi:MAG: hypothetical protein DRO40_02590 [Thermoprotei archaeon]|nr:MAG: hypothetical protein DRO40_02590 [Thermoprotei archaeon]
MSILVTGGAGFIGSWTVEYLVRNGYNVVVLDDFSSGSIDNLSKVIKEIVIVKGDIRDFELIEEIIHKYNVEKIIHLAALVSVEEAYNNPVKCFEVNAEGTLNVLEAARKHDLERVVYASSAAVYGEAKYVPIDEDHPTRPISIYGASKLSGEVLVNSYQHNYGLSTISLRYFNVYGPRMRAGDYAGVIYKFIERALLDRPPIIYGNGSQVRDFIYVEDVARANIIALESKATGTFNIGTGKAVSITELAKIIIGILGKNLEPVYTKPRPGDIKRSIANITKAREVLNWRPQVELVDGIKKTINYVRDKLRSHK